MTKSKNLQINNSIEFEFYKNYAEKVAPVMEEFEQIRRKKFGIFILAAIFLIVLTVLTWIIGYEYIAIRVFGVVFFPPLLIITARHMNKKFCSRLKAKCMPVVISNFKNLKWNCEAPDIDTSLFGEYDTRYDEDCFKGGYNGVNFGVSETKLFYMSRDKKNIIYPAFGE